MLTFELLSPGRHLPAGYWREVSGGLERVELEIGSGSGRFLGESAKRAPETFFAGFEIRRGEAARAAELTAPLPNARIYNLDGRWVVVHLVATASIDAYHIYFPDPWWKKRHHKRRLFTPKLCAALHRTLRPGGSVYVITDVGGQFHALSQALVEAGFRREPWQRGADDPAQSSYERKYRRQGRQLHEAEFLKV